MTSTSRPPESLAEATKRIARLERRLERERSAREEAESIADRGMRELWLANRELDRRVAERTLALEMALEELESTTAAGAAFISMLSHEMLTPLNGVVGMLELLEGRAHDDKTRKYIRTALASSDRLGTLLSRLLDLVELRSGRLEVETVPTSLSQLHDQLIATWQLAALKSQHLLTVQADAGRSRDFCVDEGRVLQILNELIGNAITHATPGVVEVGLRVVERPHEAESKASCGTYVVATVADSGPGFEPPEGEFWATFARLDLSPGRATEGAGIGLGLAHQLAAALGGFLVVDSAPGLPTRALLDLPVTPVAPVG